MIKLIRFLRGKVRFRVSGSFPERFINLCAIRGLPLWDGVREGEYCYFSTWPSLYKRLKPCARGAGVRLKVVERKGLPFWLRRRRRRWGLVLGAVVCLALLALSSCFLWNVEVVGNQRLDDRMILEALERQGVKPGVRVSTVDVRGVERRMMMELSDLGWIAVNLRGSTAVVRVQERVLPPKPVDRETPCNVVASRGGQILEMKVYVGQTVAAKGDAVAKGDILVSGVVEDADRDIHLVAARADVEAQTTHTLRVQVPLEQTRYRLTGVKRRYSLKLGGLELPLWIGKPPQGLFRLERMYTPVTLFGMKLPVAVGKRQYLLLQQETVTLTGQQAQEEAALQLKRLEESNFDGAKVLECRKKTEIKDGILVLQTDYTLRENIALQREIFTQEEE